MSGRRQYEYARLWVPLYDAAALAVTRPIYLVEAHDGFEGVVAEKNTTLMGVLDELGRQGWRIDMAAARVTDATAELQLLIDATLDEADHAVAPEELAGVVGSGGDPAGVVTEFDVYGMRRRSDA
ncbi:hypothetical protein ACFQ0K_02690 [Nocardioides caeni]|uniref:Uncharacterized protein n=1 Tax=Nocardioides caeni TaxID=574700 RepID=A0A4S8NSH2_9ACTN|nr:hypothetical protein [Nocardioides caeni]THV18269.1 hypothetical protein E9934_01100 [Nocardioides caeni]